MDIVKKLKEIARGKPRKINGEAHRSHVERAIIVRWGKTATLNREPLRGREMREIE